MICLISSSLNAFRFARQPPPLPSTQPYSLNPTHSTTLPFHQTATTEGVGVSFRNVSYSYDKERNLLKNLSFDVLPGQKVAIVGGSGPPDFLS